MLMSETHNSTSSPVDLHAEQTASRTKATEVHIPGTIWRGGLASCAIAEMDWRAEVAMAEFKAAAALQRDPTLPKKERRVLRQRCKEASFRHSALTFAMCICPAQSKRGLLAQVRQLREAALDGDTDQAEHLAAVILAGVEGLVSDD
jgi:hypothetical protein